jgi:hypothetical protein
MRQLGPGHEILLFAEKKIPPEEVQSKLMVLGREVPNLVACAVAFASENRTCTRGPIAGRGRSNDCGGQNLLTMGRGERISLSFRRYNRIRFA